MAFSLAMTEGKVAVEKIERTVRSAVKDFTKFIEDETINYAIDSTNEEIIKVTRIGLFRTDRYILTGNEETPVYESINATPIFPVVVVKK